MLPFGGARWVLEDILQESQSDRIKSPKMRVSGAGDSDVGIGGCVAATLNLSHDFFGEPQLTIELHRQRKLAQDINESGEMVREMVNAMV
jgi:hypothetical protein